MKPNIKKKKSKEKIAMPYYAGCSLCNKVVFGRSKSHVEYNFNLHMDKHKREGVLSKFQKKTSKNGPKGKLEPSRKLKKGVLEHG